MDVKIKDRDQKIEMLRLALNTADFGIEYWGLILFLRIQEAYAKKGGKMNMMDAAKVRATWEAERTAYDEKNAIVYRR